MENKILSNVFGTIGTVLWSVQLIPQIHLNYKRKSTKGVSPVCFGCWYACGLVLGTNLIYNSEPPALFIQITLFSIFALAIVFQHLYYQKRYNRKRLSFTFVLVILVSVALVISIYSILNADRTNKFVVELLLCIISTGLMAVGFFPQVAEVWEEKVGLSKIFVVMDFFGGVFSILSLAFHVPFDYMSFSTYVVVPICQVIIFILIIRVTLKARSESSKGVSTSFVPFISEGEISIDMDIKSSNVENDNNNNDNNNNTSINISENDEHQGDSILHTPILEKYGDDEENDKSPLRPLNASFNSIHNNFKESGGVIRESQVIPSSTLLNQSTISLHKSPLSNSSSTTVQSPLLQRQEFDHINPLSIAHTTELLIKQQQQQALAQQQAIIENSINQLRSTINNETNTEDNDGFHGYPVS
ncbi:hypothetical protein DICPUDRAFT_98992 [Dictyostelium purpureum]|uniref:PQ-loop repeat-containing protein n=1 Tax=Dictyostelium purpureum TaxID=5786 RepID=F0ZVE1_DICPU|nr:uncharacterized protein DICPUDRAFT_98992 [Dictyostelium purpureum]EGC32090.1 hypothetical protein DICPUDRAFT_98992 [Dictyostelium purpureum]|eukprot:XP_003291379.1 hypothetical protein DICPUDRAFT_98992 [Dictyostelium purpureum]